MTHNNHNIPRCQAASAYDFLIGEGPLGKKDMENDNHCHIYLRIPWR